MPNLEGSRKGAPASDIQGNRAALLVGPELMAFLGFRGFPLQNSWTDKNVSPSCASWANQVSFLYIPWLQLLQDIQPKNLFRDLICLWPRAGLLQAPGRQKGPPTTGGCEEQLFHVNLLFIERSFRKPRASVAPGRPLGKASRDYL